MTTFQAYGMPGTITLVPIAPSTGTDYLYGLILEANYDAMNITPYAPITGAHAT